MGLDFWESNSVHFNLAFTFPQFIFIFSFCVIGFVTFYPFLIDAFPFIKVYLWSFEGWWCTCFIAKRIFVLSSFVLFFQMFSLYSFIWFRIYLLIMLFIRLLLTYRSLWLIIYFLAGIVFAFAVRGLFFSASSSLFAFRWSFSFSWRFSSTSFSFFGWSLLLKHFDKTVRSVINIWFGENLCLFFRSNKHSLSK